MKKLFVLLFIAIAGQSAAQTSDYTVTMSGIGHIRIGMKKADLEKLLAKKIALHYLSPKDSGYADTIKTKYNAIDVTLYLGKQYLDDNKEEIVVTGIRSASPLCKTRTGIAIGDDKIKIVNAYETYTLYIWPDWEDDTYTKRSKTKSVVNVSADDSENTIIFHLVNKKVVAFEVMYYEGE